MSDDTRLPRRDPAPGKLKRDALERLMRFYEAAGKAEQAAEWKQKLADFTQAEAQKTSAAQEGSAAPKR